MGQYTKNGLYSGYKKNSKERAELDYYATPSCEVKNILNTLSIDLHNKTILEPCIGGGHMLEGIIEYCKEQNMSPTLIGTDFKDRGYNNINCNIQYNLDFLSDDYPISSTDIVIMNPPYSTLEPFLIRALEIAQEHLVVLCRTQVLEGEGRYKNIFVDNPPTYIYQYVNRIQCWHNGNRPQGSSAQAYCWLVWDKKNNENEPILRWIKRSKEY
ncbi:MAG: SAM-dependent DNA methyltransferase [Bacilli bacterium]|nr:SAM-dependent DNA methyltransferase [Bacilli bacterium]